MRKRYILNSQTLKKKYVSEEQMDEIIWKDKSTNASICHDKADLKQFLKSPFMKRKRKILITLGYKRPSEYIVWHN